MEEHKRTLSLIYDICALAVAYGVLVLAAYFGAGISGLAAPFWAMKAFKSSWPQWWLISLGASILGGALALGLNPFRSAGEYGYAKFATARDLKKWGLRAATGIILGVAWGLYIRFSEPLSVFVVAPPGSGKSAGIIVPNLLSCGNSTISLDVKKELFKLTAKRRATFSKVVQFAPGEDESMAWNPLSRDELPAGWDNIVLRVDQVASVLFAPENAKADTYWTSQGKAVFMLFGLYLIHKHGETSIPAIREFALSTPDAQRHIAELADEDGVPRRVKEEGYKFATKADKEWSGIFGSFNDRLDVFADPRVSRNFSRSDFSIQRIRQERTSIYLQVAAADMERLGRCLALFCEASCLSLVSRDRGPGEFVVTYFLDEFPRLPAMEAIINMPAISRGVGVNAVFVVQSESQVADRYGKDKLETLKNTCAYHVYFAQNTIEVAERISRSIGPRTRKKLSFATSETRITRNTNESNEGVPLMTAQDVMGLPERRVLILKQNNFPTPILAKDARWYLDAALKPLVM